MNLKPNYTYLYIIKKENLKKQMGFSSSSKKTLFGRLYIKIKKYLSNQKLKRMKKIEKHENNTSTKLVSSLLNANVLVLILMFGLSILGHY